MILLVDGNLVVRKFYHINEPKFSDKDQLIAETTELFRQRIDRLFEYYREVSLRFDGGRFFPVTVFDSSRRDGVNSLFRKVIDPEYKGNRTADPNADEAADSVRKMMAYSSDWQSVESQATFEADDVIASIAFQSDQPVVICSSDKDFNQCLQQGRVGICKDARVAQPEDQSLSAISSPMFTVDTYTVRSFVEEFGFGVDRFVDYQCLVGDDADNIAGAVGIGPVTAKAILTENPGVPLEEMDPDKLGLKKNQLEGWSDMIERLGDLRDLLVLRTELESWRSHVSID